MNNPPKLTPRLARAAEFIRDGAFVADIGTDHAYLPICLCLSDKARGAVASDINAGPVERARENVKKYGLDKKITVLRADGLSTLDSYAPDDIAILGMGGELIARIISDATWTKSKNIHLCLQPMTHAEILRKFLTENGYSIIDEAFVKEEKIYQLILAGYTGRSETYTAAELYLGKINIERGGSLLEEFAERQAEILNKCIKAKESAGADADFERKLLANIFAAIGRY